MEIGSSMASMYLLQNPNHYTSHIFIPFWWKSFVNKTSNIIMIQNHNIDIIMEDALQEAIKKLPFSNNEKVGDYDINIKMDVLHLENKNTSLLKNNNNENLEIHKYQTNYFELNIEIKLSTWIFWVMIWSIMTNLMFKTKMEMKIKLKLQVRMKMKKKMKKMKII
jgi:hypothetical protein